MARPKKSADEQLSEMFPIRMTVTTRETLRNKSRAAGVSEAEFIRRYIDGVPNPSPARASVDPALVTALNSYAVALGKIGNNVNQLTAATHQGREYARFWREIGEELEADLVAGREALNSVIEAMTE